MAYKKIPVDFVDDDPSGRPIDSLGYLNVLGDVVNAHSDDIGTALTSISALATSVNTAVSEINANIAAAVKRIGSIERSLPSDFERIMTRRIF